MSVEERERERESLVVVVTVWNSVFLLSLIDLIEQESVPWQRVNCLHVVSINVIGFFFYFLQCKDSRLVVAGKYKTQTRL